MKNLRIMRSVAAAVAFMALSVVASAQKYSGGVVDCAILEEDGITIIDFKTDRVTEESIRSVAEGYFPQIAVYADAMARIYKMPIKRSVLYFFGLGREIDVR